MKKSFFFLVVLALTLIAHSCSSSDDNVCNGTLEPNGNEFTYNCERYSSAIGRFYISSPNNRPTTLCLIQFVNSPYEDFYFTDDDAHINQVSIRIAIPAECYTSREIPTGTYHYYPSEDNNYEAFNILSSQVAYDSSMRGGGMLFNQYIERDDFTDITATISKSGSIFTIEYSFATRENKIIKGQFIGEMAVRNNYN